MSAGAGPDARGEERRRRLLQLASAAVFVAIAAVVVAIAIEASSTEGGDVELERVAEVNRELAGIPQAGMSLGQPDAPALLVEYGDLKCPACAAYAMEVIPDVVDAQVRSGRARIDFRNFTIIDEQSETAGAAALAAGEQGRGWNFIEIFYANQGFESEPYADGEFLTAVARAAGVADLARWNRDRRSARLLSEVEATTAEAEQVGFTGTPSFAVGGPATDGLEPVEAISDPVGELEAAIERVSADK
jgi:protein-disulfide isomerase